MENIYTKPIFFGLVGITTMIMTYATLNQTATNIEPLNNMKPIDNNKSNLNVFSNEPEQQRNEPEQQRNEPEQQRNEPNIIGGKRNKSKRNKKNKKNKKTKSKTNK